jgi:hypothetical protein
MLSIWHCNVSSRALRDIRCTAVHRTVQVTVAEKYCVGTVCAEFCADRSTGMDCAGRNSVTPFSKLCRLVGSGNIELLIPEQDRTDGRGLHIIHNVFLKVFCALCKARLSTAAWSGFERCHLCSEAGKTPSATGTVATPYRRRVLLAERTVHIVSIAACVRNVTTQTLGTQALTAKS